MNIAMMTNNYRPFIGGVPISVERLAEGLRELGHKVYVFAPAYEDKPEQDPHIVRFPTFTAKSATRFGVPNSFNRQALEIFRDLGIDAIHTHHPVLAGNTAWYLSKRHNIPLFFTWHTQYERYLHYLDSWDWMEKRAEGKKGPVQLASHLITTSGRKVVVEYVKRFANGCNKVFVPSDSMRQRVRGYGVRTSVQVLPTGLPEGFLHTDEVQAEAIRSRYIDQGKFLFCTVSRLGKEKNIEFLIRSLALFREQAGDCFKCLLIGQGPYRETLEAMVGQYNLTDNIVFLGSLPNAELKHYYAAADLFIFASKTETQGIVLLEAMSGKTPVVALEASGVRDVIQHGVNGLMTEEIPEAYCHAIHTMLQNPETLVRSGTKAHETAMACSAHLVARMAETAYRSVVGCVSKEKEYQEKKYEAVKPVYGISNLN